MALLEPRPATGFTPPFDQQARTPQQLVYRRAGLGEAGFSQRLPGSEQQVPSRADLVISEPNCLANKTFGTIPLDSLAYSLASSNAYPCDLLLVWQSVQDDKLIGPGSARAAQLFKFLVFRQTIFLTQSRRLPIAKDSVAICLGSRVNATFEISCESKRLTIRRPTACVLLADAFSTPDVLGACACERESRAFAFAGSSSAGMSSLPSLLPFHVSPQRPIQNSETQSLRLALRVRLQADAVDPLDNTEGL